MGLRFSKRDLLRGVTVEPAWYRVVITSGSTEGEPSKDKKSTNFQMEAEVICNGDNGNTKYAGVPITWNFNSKAPGFATGFMKTILPEGTELMPDTDYDLRAAEGEVLDMFVGNKEYGGRMINDVTNQYRRPRKDVVPQPQG